MPPARRAVTRAMAHGSFKPEQGRGPILNRFVATENAPVQSEGEAVQKKSRPSKPVPRSKTLASRTSPSRRLSEKKWDSWSRHSASTPFSDFSRPSPEECQTVHRLLHDMHNDAVKKNFAQGDEPVAEGKYTSALDALVVAALSQATSWRNAKRAMAHMKEVYGSTFAYGAIVEGGIDKLRDALRPGGMQNRKSKTLLGLLQDVRSRYGNWDLQFLFDATDDEVIKEVVSYWGLGLKSAHCFMSICLKRDRFAVDTHIYRLSGLWGWRPRDARVEKTQAHLDYRIPNELKYALHYEMIVHGRECKACASGTKNASQCPVQKVLPS